MRLRQADRRPQPSRPIAVSAPIRPSASFAASVGRHAPMIASTGCSVRPEQQGAGEDRPAADLVADRQPGADAQDGGLEEQPSAFAGRAQHHRAVAGAVLRRQHVLPQHPPALGQRGAHAHGARAVGIAGDRFAELVGAHRHLARRAPSAAAPHAR